ncbi:60S ribosomal protein L38 [Naegleria gruberi]|uniref:60S ribosomal protein L38 n=1 Tax=Naegleria gruberi TaxID=5762 RepID=D2VC96_NAEGR|nr:60S ribosomal protein L38 [Naegleria gruberi]EFC45615.1 60S ribosomal protein L38 [Naegleria gruberi]|eukprot:XP_002678359.1 60S ribosomal protein L38 [Naegleria gruberi strain NEG-M]
MSANKHKTKEERMEIVNEYLQQQKEKEAVKAQSDLSQLFGKAEKLDSPQYSDPIDKSYNRMLDKAAQWNEEDLKTFGKLTSATPKAAKKLNVIISNSITHDVLQNCCDDEEDILPKQILNVKEFLALAVAAKEKGSITLYKSKDRKNRSYKFKLRTRQYLYTLKMKNKVKAQQLEKALPPTLKKSYINHPEKKETKKQ